MNMETYKVCCFCGSDIYKEAVNLWYGEDSSEEDKREFIESIRDYGLTIREFDTEAERKAYLQGIEDAEGYLDMFVMPEEDHHIL